MEKNSILQIYNDYINTREYSKTETSKSCDDYDKLDEYIEQTHSKEEAHKLANMLCDAGTGERKCAFVEGFRYAVKLMRDVYGD